ncbi:MAG TPA: hypothetical protein VJR89_32975 [Polyangiales bacterium]|nr:hypothetical protein [Polyangiales bacterium]
MIALKFMRSGARSLFAGQSWPRPSAATPGAWLETGPGPLVPCKNGLHACRIEDLAFWIADELWQVELDAECISAPDALVARRARLVRRIERWDASQARGQFAERCVARAADGCRRAALPDTHRAAQYLEQAEGFARAGNAAVAAYAAALVFGALAPAAGAMTAFRTERREQGPVLADVLGLA